MELLKKDLKENGVDGDIYYCLDNGQESGYIFHPTSTSSYRRYTRIY
jgi:hypothetical protein